ncbi:hypothetical protein [Arthrobacter sp. NtRootA1]|uniref:hypothetical protein n=1 Tax=Arthrobacter sp. NtRootA1 TaxID=2830983 RepID=UPI001CC588C2|nr:hypothetical protein [Arthrobacter sp. NtRootA1]
MTTASPPSITLSIRRRAEMERQLDGAVESLVGTAKQLRQGVPVTRISPAQFEISLSQEIPYGTINEDVCW